LFDVHGDRVPPEADLCSVALVAIAREDDFTFGVL
jgi:hypothetical protein